MDDKNEHGLKLEKLGQYFSRFNSDNNNNSVPAKITKKNIIYMVSGSP